MIFAVASSVFDEAEGPAGGTEAQRLQEPPDQACQSAAQGPDDFDATHGGTAMPRIGSENMALELKKRQGMEKPNPAPVVIGAASRPTVDSDAACKVLSQSTDKICEGGSGRFGLEMAERPAEAVLAPYPASRLKDTAPQPFLPVAEPRHAGAALVSAPHRKRSDEQKPDELTPRMGDGQGLDISQRIDGPLQLDRPGRPLGPGPRRYRARLAAQFLASFLLGIAGTAALSVAYNKIAVSPFIHFRHGTNFTDIRRMNDPLALPRMYRDNRLISYLDFVVNRSTKQSHAGFQLAAVESASRSDATADGDPAVSGTGSIGHSPAASLDGAAGLGGPETPAEAGISRLPSLHFGSATRRQVVGNFETRSFPGDRGSCTEMAQSMIADGRAGQDSLYTLADSKEIKVMKFCAANGMVMITCRNGRITVSPRRPRPDDGCNTRQVFR